MELNETLKKLVFDKSDLKGEVQAVTREAFTLFRDATREMTTLFKEQAEREGRNVKFEFADRGELEFEMKFAGDVLVFMMHSDVFEFSRNHDVMKTAYVREDDTRSYCGVIHIYNFLYDSFAYHRENDMGYLIGRVFVNREGHYFIEGKRELGMLYNNFGTSVITPDSVQGIVEGAVEYTTNFDLLTPPFDEVKTVSVAEMEGQISKKSMVTAKRLGFRFQADKD